MHLGRAAASGEPVANTPAVPVAPAETATALMDYTGALGADSIVATWTVKGGEVNGSWFRISDANDVPISGHMTSGKTGEQISLAEGPAGSPQSEVLLTRVPEATDARRGLQREQWTGTWISADRSRSLPVMLTLRDTMPGATEANRYAIAGVTDPAAVESSAEAFRKALLNGDVNAASAQVAFPLVVTIAGKRSLLHSKEAFAEHFTSLLTPEFLASIRNATAHDMYATERGIRLGDGEVWFSYTGQAFAIDNAPVRIFAGRRFLSNHGYTATHRKRS